MPSIVGSALDQPLAANDQMGYDGDVHVAASPT